ncbi:hypothetical protein FV232_07280 [Methylobacterium sp. WL30]|uniref:hypothetical protein n=1 Tax=unclassified Methylobacterium TaxID=2615210 RepID=UPI0011CBD4E2|nr:MULTISPECIES: hypothetical protein [unclassified Methylobacterium]TXM95415.1 hypothetical protein FV223_00645 [Methylobacterium sp. WL116]TXN41810.1 hypothetical protein FV225_01000 [Methylobacterium sp. WL93]TXN51877.1 hypothetical protein FV227_05950 [Methylobacterium sp. WL119]TXN68860.1 hypothetical protein FV232_07280 [Methylobacterium sp. WL30]
MRTADPDQAAHDAIEAIRLGLDRHFSEADYRRLKTLRRSVADRIESDLALLDMLAGDVDLEPSLGAPEAATHTYRDHGPLLAWGSGATDDREDSADDDREEENEHGGDVQDEPHDAEVDERDTAPEWAGVGEHTFSAWGVPA